MKKLLPGILILVLLGGLLGLPTAYFLWLGREWSYRCEEHPPSETFRRFLGVPSLGVWDIRAAGYNYLSGATIWMRFRAGEGSLSPLVQGYDKLPAKEARATLEHLVEMESYWQPRVDPSRVTEAHRVYWQELRRLPRPEVYRKPHEDGSTVDTLIVDRQRWLVYYHHFNQ